jgi:RecJ-like exonuclease
MRCEVCQGTGQNWLTVICSECGGSGLQHCCEGLREQPEPKEPETPEIS